MKYTEEEWAKYKEMRESLVVFASRYSGNPVMVDAENFFQTMYSREEFLKCKEIQEELLRDSGF